MRGREDQRPRFAEPDDRRRRHGDLARPDRVAGFFFAKADLEALAAKKATAIPVKSYSGYWWSDGSHYRFANASCKLK